MFQKPSQKASLKELRGIIFFMDGLRIETFGGVQLKLGGETVKLSRRKSIALLVYLAVTGERHSREALAAMFWPENTAKRAYANLRQVIWEIRSSLGENSLDVTRDSIQLGVSDDLWVDVVKFNNLLAKSKTHLHPGKMLCEKCLTWYRQASKLYKGDFLAGFNLHDSPAFDDWCFFQADELQRDMVGVCRQMVDWLQETQAFEPAIGYAHRWLQFDKLNEDAHRTLMQLFTANGQRNAAIRQYQTCVETLKHELSITPEAATTDLFKKIKSGELEISQPEPEEIPPLGDSKLPIQLTPFVGRLIEIPQLSNLLKDPDIRLLTILAPGGMGKSRLAIEIARKLETHFDDGIFFVPLAPLESSEMFLNYFADVIGCILFEGKPIDQQITDFFREKSTLLLLDNFEHLIDKASWIRDLLASSPNLKVLVTSRMPLNIEAETRFHLSGLAFPGGELQTDLNSYSAVKLFLQSARRASPLFKPEKDDWKTIGEICRLVGGMPLGIEMAAAWLEMLSLPEIVEEIRRGLGIFESTRSDIPENQHNLYSVFEYSWKTLTDQERDLFPQLSIFRGGFTRSAAEAIVGISLRQLVGLVNRSLLIRRPDDRFEIHELLRQYGLEKLQSDPGKYRHVKTCYAEFFCRKLDSWHEDLKTGRQHHAMLEIGADFENIRHSWEIAVRLERFDLVASAFAGLILYLIQRVRYDEAVSLFEYADQNLPDETRKGARLLSWLTGHLVLLNATLGKLDQVEQLFQKHLSTVDQLGPIQTGEDKFAQAFHLYVKAIYLENRGDHFHLFKSLCLQSINLFQEVKEDWWCQVIYRDIGSTAWLIEMDLENADKYFHEALQIARKLNDHYGVAVTLEQLGWMTAYNKGDLEQAEGYLLESSRIFHELDYTSSYIHHLTCLEQIANIKGHFREVLKLRQKHLDFLGKLGDPSGIAEMNMLLGETYHHVGDYDSAYKIGRKGFDYLSERGSRFYQAWCRWFLGLTTIAQEDYQQAYFLISQAVEINREIGNEAYLIGNLAALVRVALAKDDYQAAKSLLGEGLKKAIVTGESFMMLYILASAALYLAQCGKADKALEIYSSVHSWAFTANSQWFADVYMEPLMALTGEEKLPKAERQPKEVLWQMAESLLEELEQA